MSSEIEYYRQLSTIMHSTRGARFTAASSLVVIERWSVATTAALSLLILAWSVALVAAPDTFSDTDTRFFGGLTIIASVSVLVLTLLDYAYARGLRAEKLQQNALTISVLMREMERELCSSAPDVNRLRTVAERYEASIAETQVNHSSADYKKWKIESEKPSGFWASVWRSTRLAVNSIRYYTAPVALHISIVVTLVAATLIYLN